jgi:hypothetical protein
MHSPHDRGRLFCVLTFCMASGTRQPSPKPAEEICMQVDAHCWHRRIVPCWVVEDDNLHERNWQLLVTYNNATFWPSPCLLIQQYFCIPWSVAQILYSLSSRVETDSCSKPKVEGIHHWLAYLFVLNKRLQKCLNGPSCACFNGPFWTECDGLFPLCNQWQKSKSHCRGLQTVSRNRFAPASGYENCSGPYDRQYSSASIIRRLLSKH